MFGFSRGAATVRALTGFIDCCGLVNRKRFITDDDFNEDKFSELIESAIKTYETKDPKKQASFKSTYSIHKDNDVPIHFIGVWDTVSALGFPQDSWFVIKWISSGIDKISDFVWPHHFYNYELTPGILNAYHAISIDDERQTFSPMIWTEEKSNKSTQIVEQVWFAGVHSNVGGGYPRYRLIRCCLTLDDRQSRGQRIGVLSSACV